MNKTLLASLGVVFGVTSLFTAVGCGGSTTATALEAPQIMQPAAVGQSGHILVPSTSLPQPAGFAHTNHLIFIPDKQGISPMAANPGGKSVSQMRAAYGLGAFGGSGVIAIVDAYHYNTSLNDFNFFSNYYGLPAETSTNATASSNQHFQVVYASGSKPRSDSGWALEAAMDIEWAHAMAPNAKIVLVEAASNSLTNLIAAENVAKQIAGCTGVSNSWGSSESSSSYSNDSVFVQSGVVFFASGGDSGGVKSWPALSKNVVAVGGTTLNMSGNTVTSETAWSSTGCGISAYEPRPAFQNNVSTIVGAFRGADDIAADADPNTGASVYDTTTYQGLSGWITVGGTSLSCPLMAGMANASGTHRASSDAQNTAFYAGLGGSNFKDITSGTAGSYSARVGYDLPTGVGVPNGLGGF